MEFDELEYIGFTQVAVQDLAIAPVSALAAALDHNVRTERVYGGHSALARESGRPGEHDGGFSLEAADLEDFAFRDRLASQKREKAHLPVGQETADSLTRPGAASM
jgi:hypothetical protein